MLQCRPRASNNWRKHVRVPAYVGIELKRAPEGASLPCALCATSRLAGLFRAAANLAAASHENRQVNRSYGARSALPWPGWTAAGYQL